jgi:putative flippase GtrA
MPKAKDRWRDANDGFLRTWWAGAGRKRLTMEAAGFVAVGALNFVLTLAVFYSLLRILKVHYLVALSISWVIGMVFSYVLNFTWVFKPEQKFQFKARFGKFFIASLLSIALNMLALQLIVVRTRFDPFYVQFALIPLIVVFNFVTAKFWSLKPVDR